MTDLSHTVGKPLSLSKCSLPPLIIGWHPVSNILIGQVRSSFLVHKMEDRGLYQCIIALWNTELNFILTIVWQKLNVLNIFKCLS